MQIDKDNPHTPNLDWQRKAFHQAGWFIPPYMTLEFLGKTAKEIETKGATFSEADLEKLLSHIYSPDYLATMLLDRYSATPRINDFISIIYESVQAHFLGMHHVSASGLLPVIEGAGKIITEDRMTDRKIGGKWFKHLIDDCIDQVTNRSIGMPGEIISMMNSFHDYAKENLYSSPERYAYKDGTNRHAILHGDYADSDYGRPLNFYKCISAIDFLCLISKLKHSASWFAPPITEKSQKLADYFSACANLAKLSPWSTSNIPLKP